MYKLCDLGHVENELPIFCIIHTMMIFMKLDISYDILK